MPVSGDPAWEVSTQPLPLPVTQCITLRLSLVFPETGLLPERKLGAMEEGRWRREEGQRGRGREKGWERVAHTRNSQPL